MSDVGDPGAASRVFISYRREETAYPAGWLYDRLGERFGGARVFKDVDSIALGDDFVEAITRAVGSCDVLIALIGDQWLTVSDEHGRRRLDDPHDYVRLEVEAALARNVRVIPVLVDGARMPRAEELPDALAPLVRRQALELSPSRFDSDTERLILVLASTLVDARASNAGPAGEGATPEPAVAQSAVEPAAGASASERTRQSKPPATAEAPTRRRSRRNLMILAVVAGVVGVVAVVATVVAILSQDDSDDSADPADGVVITGEPDTSPDGLELTDFRVEVARDPAVVGDRVTVSFLLTNVTDASVEFAETFVGVRNAADDRLDTDGTNEGAVVGPGETLDGGGQVALDSTGLWLFWPCYALVDGQECPSEWRVVQLLVE